MRKYFIGILMIGFMLFIAACGSSNSVPNTGGNSVSQAATLAATVVPPTSTLQAISGAAQATAAPAIAQSATQANSMINTCSLLNSQDLAHLFTSAEIIAEPAKTSQVTHPAFSQENAPGTETTCLYYTYNQPGKSTGETLQVTYWVDTPAPGSQAAWDKAWTDASSGSTQVAISKNESAFFSNGQLVIKNGNEYVTLSAVDTRINANTVAGASQLLNMEKQLAQDILNRLNSSSSK